MNELAYVLLISEYRNLVEYVNQFAEIVRALTLDDVSDTKSEE